MSGKTQKGEVLDCVAPTGGVVAGLPVLIGSLLVVPLTTAAETDTFAGETIGVFEIVKAAGQAWTQFVKIYWDNTNKNFTTTSSGNTLVGVAAFAAATADVVGYVRLDGVAR